MKYTFALIGLLISIGFTSCKKDQKCTCTTTSSATSDGEEFPLYEPTSSVKQYEEKLKDSESGEWCESFEDSTTYDGFKDGFNFEVFEKTTCSV